MNRAEAIKWIEDRMCQGRGVFTENHPPNIDECWEAGRMAIEALKSERPKGEWYILEYELFTCDQCGEYVESYAEYTQEARDMLEKGDYPNYCPN